MLEIARDMAYQWKLLAFFLVVRAGVGVQFEGQRVVSVSESGSARLRLVRQQAFSSNAEIANLEFLTVDQYLSGVGSQPCGLQAADLGLANSSTFDAAEATDFPDGSSVGVTFAPGQTHADEDVTVTVDNIAERNEVFIVALASSETNCAVVVQIVDDDVVRISFNRAEFQDETISGNFSEMKLVKQGTHEVNFEVTVQSEPSTATENLDFILQQRTFLFTPNITELVVPITILDDNISESIETVLICLPASIQVAQVLVEPVAPTCSEISLIDDDDLFVGFPGLSLRNPTITVMEGDSGTLTFGFLGRSRDLSFFTEVLASLSPLDGITDNRILVEADRIFRQVLGPTPQPYQIGGTLLNISSTVLALQNNAVDGTATFNFSLDGLVGASVNQPAKFATQMAILKILDDDRSEFNIMVPSPSTSEVREGETIQFVITRSSNPINVIYTVIVSVTTEDSASDFRVTPSSFIFNNDTFLLPGNITFLEDDIPRADSTYRINVNVTADVPLSVPPVESSIVVTIADDDAHTFTISPAMVTATEGQAGNVSFLITRSPAAATTVYIVTVGVQQAGYESDFTLSNTTFIFGPLNSTLEGSIIIGDDKEDRGNRSFTISITNISYTTSLEPTAAGMIEITIIDDDGDNSTGGLGGGRCIPCIVVPIVVIFAILLCLLCILLIILFLCCCKRSHWLSYYPKKKEMKYGDLRKAYSS